MREKTGEECDAHSCEENAQTGDDFNDYCQVCGKLVKTLEQKEYEAEFWLNDYQKGDIEMF